MSDKIEKSLYVLEVMRFGDTYAISDIAKRLGEHAPSPATMRRDLGALHRASLLRKTGAKRGTTYQKTLAGSLRTPIHHATYFSQGGAERNALTTYQFALLEECPSTFFTQSELATLTEATATYHTRERESSPGVRDRELERLVIELSWKSSAIEGNTYTLLDTERLLRESTEAEGHSKEEAIMILNHKKAFEYTRTLSADAPLTMHFVEDLHALLVEGLGVSRGIRHGEVGVLGAEYRPLAVPAQLEAELAHLCACIEMLTDPYSKALLALVGISYLQPFEDGNKRTARLLANALLLQARCAPLSYRNVDVARYRESMLVFYEQLSLEPMKQIFSEQYVFACMNYLMGKGE